MLSHDNISWTVLSGLATMGMVPNAEVFVSYLPLNHVAAQMVELWAPLFSQVEINKELGLVSFKV